MQDLTPSVIARVDRRGMAVVSSAHAMADCCQAAVAALLPFLIAENGWSYATASALVLAGAVSSSIVQPVLDDWPSFARLGVVIGARTVLFFGLLTFVPLYFVDVLQRSEQAGNTALIVFLAGGAFGTLAGGRLADRVGRRLVVIGSLTVATPLVLLFLALPAAAATPLLFVIGAAVISSFSVTVVMGQEYLPNRIGIASGVTLGLAIGLGGLAAPLLGLLADANGLETALLVAGLMPLVGVAATLTLPRERPRVAATA